MYSILRRILVLPTFQSYFGLLLLTGCQLTAPIDQQIPTYRNVLFIISDDLATHAVGCYGNPLVKTPNIDRLASMGVRFEAAYANAPMCTPSRATLLTGRYPYAVGVTLLQTPLPDAAYTVAEHLKAAGFATGVFGKTHFNSRLKHGFDTLVNNQHHRAYLETLDRSDLHDSILVRPKWKPFRDHARVWLNAAGATSGNSYENSQGTFFANSTIDFIRQHRNERFFAVASFREPHSPFNFPIEYQGRHAQSPIELPQGSWEDSLWIPRVFNDLTDEEKKGITRAYYTSVEYMDRNVGLLLDELEQSDLLDSTLIVFVGDHGYLLNHHARFEKHMMWEEAVKTPLIIKGYGVHTIEKAVELADIAPTIVTALGLSAMPHQHGQSLIPLMTEEEATHRTYIFSVYYTDNKAMIKNERWKYIFGSGKQDLGSGYATGNPPAGITHRLYDQQNDPTETQNVALQHPTILKTLQQVMLEKFRATHPKAAQISSDLSIEDQLVLFCEPPEL